MPIMTAYRQRALACAAALTQGPRRSRDLKADIPDAPKILRGNVYGWFAAARWFLRVGRLSCLKACAICS
jgi:hypothetical protein